jgi:preprotein translocase subunit SecF
MRSLNTSLVAILPILSLLIFGAGVFGAVSLADFGFALFIGLLTGAYSSIFIASPVVALLKEREPQWKTIAERLSGKAPAANSSKVRAAGAAEIDATTALTGGAVPRPRKKS